MVKGTVLASFGPEYVIYTDHLYNKVVGGLTDGSVQEVDLHKPAGSREIIEKGVPLAGLAVSDGILCVAKTDGNVGNWDPRAGHIVQTFKTAFPLASVAMRGNEIAVGTELADQDAGVLLWDTRNISGPKRTYIDSHNDDVCDVSFHPHFENTLISGSTDGYVSLYNTSLAEDEDAIYQTINNEASIHLTAFLSDNRFFALSHIETLAIYQVTDPDDNIAEPKPVEFGDLREAWNCEYVADYDRDSFLIGSNSEGWLKLVPFTNESPGTPIDLEEGHGEDVVRCMRWVDQNRLCTGGEDGTIKLWSLGPSAGEASAKHRGPGKDRKSLKLLKKHKAPY